MPQEGINSLICRALSLGKRCDGRLERLTGAQPWGGVIAILLLLVTYGLRGCEIAGLKLDDIDWGRERLLISERKAGHNTAYPLSHVVGEAIVDYLKRGRPDTSERYLFFNGMAPRRPMTASSVSQRVTHYLYKAGIKVGRPGSHTLRHTCVQRLVYAEFFKTIGDYVGHASPASTRNLHQSCSRSLA